LTKFTYVPLAGRFGYIAFVIDAFASMIPELGMLLEQTAAFAESAIHQAAAFRARHGHSLPGRTIHHSEAGSLSAPPCASPRRS
jgi:hypothetical protein